MNTRTHTSSNIFANMVVQTHMMCMHAPVHTHREHLLLCMFCWGKVLLLYSLLLFSEKNFINPKICLRTASKSGSHVSYTPYQGASTPSQHKAWSSLLFLRSFRLWATQHEGEPTTRCPFSHCSICSSSSGITINLARFVQYVSS